MAAVAGLPDAGGRVEQNVRIFRRPDKRLRAHRAGGHVGRGGRSHGGLLAGEPVIDGHLAAVDEIRIFRIGRGFAILFDADRMPVVEGDLAIHAAAVHAGGAGILLAAAQAIGEGVVGRHMVHGGGGLVVPVAPGSAAVGGDDAALVAHQENDVGINRVDPALLVIVAARSAAHGGPGEAGVFGPPEHGRAAVDDLFVLRIHRDGGQIAAADAAERTIVRRVAAGGAGLVDAGIVGGQNPVLAAVRGLVERDVAAASATSRAPAGAGCGRAFRGCAARRYGRVKDFRITRGDGEVGLDDGGQATGEFLPGIAAVGRFEDAAVGPAKRPVFEEALLLLPERGVDGVGLARVEPDVVAAGVFVLVENLLEAGAAIGGAEDAALRVGAVGVSQRGDEQAVGILRIHFDVGDHLRIAQAEVRPGFAGVGGFVHAVADREVRPDDARAAADVDDVRVGRRDRDSADGAGGLVIEQGRPGGAVIRGAPDAAVIETDVEHVGLAGHARQSTRASGAGRADLPPVHFGIKVGRNRLGNGRRGHFRGPEAQE